MQCSRKLTNQRSADSDRTLQITKHLLERLCLNLPLLRKQHDLFIIERPKALLQAAFTVLEHIKNNIVLPSWLIKSGSGSLGEAGT